MTQTGKSTDENRPSLLERLIPAWLRGAIWSIMGILMALLIISMMICPFLWLLGVFDIASIRGISQNVTGSGTSNSPSPTFTVTAPTDIPTPLPPTNTPVNKATEATPSPTPFIPPTPTTSPTDTPSPQPIPAKTKTHIIPSTSTPTKTLVPLPTNTPVSEATPTSTLSPIPPTPSPTNTATATPVRATAIVTEALPTVTATTTMTTTPTSTPVPPVVTNINPPASSSGLPSGTLTLLNPLSLDLPTYGLTIFEWEWVGDPLAPRFGFEVSTWLDGEARAGVHDAVKDNGPQGEIIQIGENRYQLRVTNIRYAKGVLGRTNDYLWTVGIVQVNPNYEDYGLQANPAQLRYEFVEKLP